MAHATFTDIETVRSVVADMLSLGIVRDLSQNLGQVSQGCHLVFPSWEKYQQNYRRDKSRNKDRKPQSEAKKAPVSQNLGQVSQDSTDITDSTDKTKDDGDPIVAALDRVAFSRNLTLKLDSAKKANERYADRDLGGEVEGFAAYWTDGPGASRPLKDVAWAWRNWLGRAEPAPKTKASDFSKYDKRVRRAAA